jgi:hypothetical protein
MFGMQQHCLVDLYKIDINHAPFVNISCIPGVTYFIKTSIKLIRDLLFKAIMPRAKIFGMHHFLIDLDKTGINF